MKIGIISSLNVKTSQNKNNNQKASNITFIGRIKNNSLINSDVVEIFKDLAKIPSPPLKESKVANWILSFCKKNKINAELDSYKNIKINIQPTDNTKQPLLISAHMDVVGDNSPINIITDGNFLKTDGKRTLGADDKAGIAVALKLAKEFSANNIKHGGIEMLFTRDEELGMTGILNADLRKFKSKYVLVLDEAKLGKFDNAGAGYTTVNISLTTPYGGHSGMDIEDKYRLNAAKVISELISEMPQGMYYKDDKGSITSLNVGTIIAGDIQNSAAKIVEDKLISDNYLGFFMKNSVTNVINTQAMATLSIRSSNQKREYELRQLLTNIVEKFNNKYKNLVKIDINFEELIPIFEKSNDKTMEKIYKKSCNAINLKPCIGTFPAGAETHIFANMKNKNDEQFLPTLLGIADIFNMHSPLEKINIASLRKGYELVKDMFLKFNGIN